MKTMQDELDHAQAENESVLAELFASKAEIAALRGRLDNDNDSVWVSIIHPWTYAAQGPPAKDCKMPAQHIWTPCDAAKVYRYVRL